MKRHRIWPRTLPELPPIGRVIRDPQNVEWHVVGHLEGVATLAAVRDATTRRKITREQYEVWLSSNHGGDAA